MVESEEYQGHPVFKDLDHFVEFYEQLGYQTSMFLAQGTKAILELDTYVFSSLQGTLDSVRMLLRAGMMNDAYALVRKFHDAAVINAYTAHYLKSHFSLEHFLVERIESWRSGKVALPRFKTMLNSLKDDDKLAALNRVLESDRRYEQLRERCNGHVHFSYYEHMLINIRDIYLNSRVQVLSQLRRDLRDIVVLHLAYVFSINPAYMASSDYVDALECWLQPEEGSQYWVARNVQEMFDRYISPWRPDVAAVVKANSSMNLLLRGA